jgi:hypothetical protein
LYAPQAKVIIDARCELYGAEFLMRFRHLQDSAPDEIDDWVERYDFQYALVFNDSLLGKHLDSSRDWTLVQRGQCASLFRYAKMAP